MAGALETFAKADAALVSVSESLDTESAAGRLVVNMLGVVAQWEREANEAHPITFTYRTRGDGDLKIWHLSSLRGL